MRRPSKSRPTKVVDLDELYSRVLASGIMSVADANELQFHWSARVASKAADVISSGKSAIELDNSNLGEKEMPTVKRKNTPAAQASGGKKKPAKAQAAQKPVKAASESPAAPQRQETAVAPRPSKPITEHKRAREGTPLAAMTAILENEGPWEISQQGTWPAGLPTIEHKTKEGDRGGVITFVGWPVKNWYVLKNAKSGDEAREVIVGHHEVRKYAHMELDPLNRVGGPRKKAAQEQFDRHFDAGEDGSNNESADGEGEAAGTPDGDALLENLLNPGAESEIPSIRESEVEPPETGKVPAAAASDGEEDFSFLDPK